MSTSKDLAGRPTAHSQPASDPRHSAKLASSESDVTRRANSPSAISSRASGFEMIDSTSKDASRELLQVLDAVSLEDIVEAKISRLLEQMGGFFQEMDNLHHLILRRIERPLFRQVMQRTGGNQVHAARILGINRNTLRKKIKLYDL